MKTVCLTVALITVQTSAGSTRLERLLEQEQNSLIAFNMDPQLEQKLI